MGVCDMARRKGGGFNGKKAAPFRAKGKPRKPNTVNPKTKPRRKAQ
jgi:hypothetical protein